MFSSSLVPHFVVTADRVSFEALGLGSSVMVIVLSFSNVVTEHPMDAMKSVTSIS